MPDSSFINSELIIFPTPFVNDTLGDGIPVEACINSPYDITFFVRSPKTIEFAGLNLTVESIRIDSVQNLPEGITYSCSAENCEVLADSTTCIFLTGTPNSNNEPGAYELVIFLTIKLVALPGFTATFPDPNLAPGSYTLVLNNEGSPACDSTTAVADLFVKIDRFEIYPNPVQDELQIRWNAITNSDINILISDLTGQILKRENLSTGRGYHQTNVQMEMLQSGFYLVGIEAEGATVWKKLIKE
jgi:hypothetical protein